VLEHLLRPSTRALRWIDEQTDLISSIKHFMEEPLPKKVGWAHVFGSALLFVFLLQLVTGVFMMLYYAPTADHAYESVSYIQHRLLFGRIVRGLHHWGATAMVVMLGLHIIQVFIWAAYKYPRQVVWVIGVLLMLVVFAFSFTGYLLPWDMKAYWATVVGTNIAASIPYIGETLRTVLRGGEEVGSTTLSRFYTLHVAMLPPLISALILFHVLQLRKKGITAPWQRVGEEEAVEKPQRFYPDQVFKDVVFALALLCGLLWLAGHHPAPLEPRANPADTTYVPRPEWYFLPLFEILKHLPGKYGEFIGAVLIPGVAVLLMLIYPYLDRNRERLPQRRPFAMLLLVGTFSGVTYFGVQGLKSMPQPRPLNLVQRRGEKIFLDLRCHACHGINGGGGTTGPDLATSARRHKPDELKRVLLQPTAFNPRSTMPVVDLAPADLSALMAYLQSLNPNSRMPRVPTVGPMKPTSHFEEEWPLLHKFEVRKDPTYCESCHQPRFCRTCHQKRRPDSHLTNWLQFHYGVAAEKPEYCKACHDTSYCEKCHQQLLHRPDWMRVHQTAARTQEKTCHRCHQSVFCVRCHKGAKPTSHTANWLHQHPQAVLPLRAATGTERGCLTCHTQASCVNCHTGAKPASHTAGWMKSHGRSALRAAMGTGQGCQTCHSAEMCSNCHQLEMPHPRGFAETTHPIVARQQRNLCSRCHTQRDCAACHQTHKPASHTRDWRKSHAQKVAGRAAACTECHARAGSAGFQPAGRMSALQAGCADCHQREYHHPKDWLKVHKQSASFNTAAQCFQCHPRAYCRQCHEEPAGEGKG